MDVEDARTICIPVAKSEESVEVFVDDLPDNPEDITDILRAEAAPFTLWRTFALEYYRQNNFEAFEAILQDALDPDLEEHYSEERAERIAIINVLANYKAELGDRETDPQKKQLLFTEATTYFNNADKIDPRDMNTWLGKGLLLVYQGDNERALNNFNTVLQMNRSNVPALLGKARVLFHSKKYSKALETYREALSYKPDCPASVRVPIALCLFKLNRPQLAERMLRRVLELDENNVEALAHLAIMIYSGSSGTRGVQEATLLLKRAYEADRNHPRVLNFLANYFFYTKDYSKVSTLANSSFRKTNVLEMKAESVYFLGLAAQAQGNYANAFGYFFEAARLYPGHLLSQFRLGQMHLHKREFGKALACFEKVHAVYPDTHECHKLLGVVYAETQKTEKAIQHLTRANQLHSGNWSTWLELAQLQELVDADAALLAYEKAIRLMIKEGESIPMEVWNNIGFLRHGQGNFSSALNAYKRAVTAEISRISGEPEKPDSINIANLPIRATTVTPIYNMARLLEDKHEYVIAEDIYKRLLKEHPNYLDCYFRLGYMYSTRCKRYEAREWFKDTLSIRDNAEAWIVLGKQHLDKREWLQAQKKFESILDTDRSDSYGLVAMGNIYYYAAVKDKKEKYRALAKDYFMRAMSKDKRNIFGVNGVAMLLAEGGHFPQAKDFFLRVREALGDNYDSYINLGHVYLGLGRYQDALKLYKKCLQKFNATVELYQYIANAAYSAGQYQVALRNLQRALHLKPMEQSILHNIGVCHSKLARDVFSNDHGCSLELVHSSIASLQKAIHAFQILADLPSTRSYSAKKAKTFLSNCQKLKDKSVVALEKAEAKERERVAAAERLEEQLKKKQDDLRKKKEEEEALRQAEKKKEEDVLRTALEAEERACRRIKSDAELLKNSSTKTSRARKRRRPRDSPTPEASSDEDFEDKGEAEASSSSESEQEQSEEEPEFDEGEPRKKKRRRHSRRRKKKVAEGGEGEEEGATKKDKKKKKKKKKKKRRLKKKDGEEEADKEANVDDALEQLKKKRQQRQKKQQEGSDVDSDAKPSNSSASGPTPADSDAAPPGSGGGQDDDIFFGEEEEEEEKVAEAGEADQANSHEPASNTEKAEAETSITTTTTTTTTTAATSATTATAEEDAPIATSMDIEANGTAQPEVERMEVEVGGGGDEDEDEENEEEVVEQQQQQQQQQPEEEGIGEVAEAEIGAEA